MNTNENYQFLISKFSHELRNPLTAVYSTLQLVENKCPTVKDVKYWSSLSGDIEYMIELLNDFASFSSNRLQLASFSMDVLMKQVVLSFAASLVDSQIQFTSKINTCNQKIIGDSVKLQEVFRNLLKNAAEACSAGDSIYLSTTSTENAVEIIIQDTGCGISEEQLPTVFDPFVTYKKQGSGLGLPICKQIVEAHHGSIHISSSSGGGTIVNIKLPTNNQCEQDSCD